MRTDVYISITRNVHRLIIDGDFDLFKTFISMLPKDHTAIAKPTIYNPAPDLAGEVAAKP